MIRPVKLPVLRIGQPLAASCAATCAARCCRRELLSTMTGSFAACVDAGVAVAGGSLTGGAAGVEAEADDGGDDGGGGDVEAVLDAGGVVNVEAGCSATAPGPGPLAEGRLLITSRITTTATTAVTAASGGGALRISWDAGLGAGGEDGRGGGGELTPRCRGGAPTGPAAWRCATGAAVSPAWGRRRGPRDGRAAR